MTQDEYRAACKLAQAQIRLQDALNILNSVRSNIGPNLLSDLRRQFAVAFDTLYDVSSELTKQEYELVKETAKQ